MVLLILKVFGIAVSVGAGIWGVLADNGSQDAGVEEKSWSITTDQISILFILLGAVLAIGSEVFSWFDEQKSAALRAAESAERTEEILETILEAALPLERYRFTATFYEPRKSLPEEVQSALNHDAVKSHGRAYGRSFLRDAFDEALVDAGLDEGRGKLLASVYSNWSVHIWSSRTTGPAFEGEPELSFVRPQTLESVARLGSGSYRFNPVPPDYYGDVRSLPRESRFRAESMANLSVEDATLFSGKIVRFSDLEGGRIELEAPANVTEAGLVIKLFGREVVLEPYKATRIETVGGVKFRWEIPGKSTT